MSTHNLLGNSAVPNYVKLTATGIVASTYLAALAVAVDVYVTQGPMAQLPSIVTFVLGTGVSLALGILGLHQGASLAESTPPGTALEAAPTPPPTPAQQTGGTSNAGTPTA